LTCFFHNGTGFEVETDKFDQYQVSTDKRSGIVNDPNREDDPEYIVRLIGQVIHVSLETVKRTREFATLALLPTEVGAQ
jgi:hypothetical protein